MRSIFVRVCGMFVGLLMLTTLMYASAQNRDGSITLTPSKLYELIEVEQKKSGHQTVILKLVRDRLAKAEDRISELEKREKLQAEALGNLSVKIQETRNQTARIILRLDNKKADK